MCFTPAASLTTAIIEIVLASILFHRYRQRHVAAMILVLGLYQFTEFMLCVGNHPFFWAAAGFVAYSFLPAIGLHLALKLRAKRVPVWLLYLIPIAAALTALVPGFISTAQCTPFHVEVQTLFGQQSPLLSTLYVGYMLYYFGFIVLTLLLFLQQEKQSILRQRNVIMAAALVAMFVPTFILLILFPYLAVRFPSILCGFALLTALGFFWAIRVEGKHARQRKDI